MPHPRISRLAIALLALIFAVNPALAGGLDTASCRADLTRASTLIDAVARRDRAGPASDTKRLCAVLHANRHDMAEAARLMDGCLTGHDKGENVGQLQASVKDVDVILGRKCR